MNKKLLILVWAWLSLIPAFIFAGNGGGNIPTFPKQTTNFIIANDLGRNGYYEQKPIARLMGEVAEASSIELIAAAGDVHHFGGVASVNDPLWMTNYELIYDHPELMIDWFAVLGNHEYRGNTQSVLDYSDTSRRWNMPARYYTQSLQIKGGTTCQLVFIDTTPLIGKYQSDVATYPDAVKQDESAQLQWLDSVLVHSAAQWKIVIGHHPVYAQTTKSADEREELQAKIAPILEKNEVNVYFCGHIHNFQHIKPIGATVEYVVNSSGSLSRPVQPTEGTVYCNPDPGFTVCSVSSNALEFSFINHKGEAIYTYRVTK